MDSTECQRPSHRQIGSTSSVCPQCGRPSDRENLYTALVNIRNTEVTVYWTRYNIQAVLNTAVFAVGLAGLKKPDPLPPNILFALAVGGVVLAVFWLCFAVQGKKLFVDGWEEWIAEYEERWLTPQYGSSNAEQVLPTRPFLLFYGIKARGDRSPIHPDPVRRRRERSASEREAYPRTSCRWWRPAFFEPSNLNLVTRSLPILFGVAWICLAWYIAKCQ